MKEVLAEKHFVESDSDRPDICLAIVRLMIENFWCHVERGAQNGLGGLVFRAQQLGEPKISNFDDSVMAEYVGKFEISVHDLAFD
jgi:hypothetical protein